MIHPKSASLLVTAGVTASLRTVMTPPSSPRSSTAARRRTVKPSYARAGRGSTGPIRCLSRWWPAWRGSRRSVPSRAELSGPEALELFGPFDGLHPVVAKRRVQLRRRCWEARIGEVPDCDHHDRTSGERPEHCGTARRAEVVRDVISVGGADAIALEAVVDPALTCNGDTFVVREDRTDLEGASCSPLAEGAMTRHHGDGFPFHGDVQSPAGTCGCSGHFYTLAQTVIDGNQGPGQSWAGR